MRGYGQFCPIAKAAEIVAERWTPLILRELLYGSHRFGELRRGIPLISPSLLAQRLKSLERDGILDARRPADGRGCEYVLTPAGEALRPVVEQLGTWGHRGTIDKLRAEDYEPAVLRWFLHRLILTEHLPERRIVVRFAFQEGRHRLWWLVMHKPNVDLCLRDEGFEVDLYVAAETTALGAAIQGHRALSQAIRDGLIDVDGPRDLVRAFPTWIGVSPYATAPEPALAP